MPTTHTHTHNHTISPELERAPHNPLTYATPWNRSNSTTTKKQEKTVIELLEVIIPAFLLVKECKHFNQMGEGKLAICLQGFFCLLQTHLCGFGCLLEPCGWIPYPVFFFSSEGFYFCHCGRCSFICQCLLQLYQSCEMIIPNNFLFHTVSIYYSLRGMGCLVCDTEARLHLT